MFNARPSIYRNPLFWVVISLTVIALFLGIGISYASARLNSLFREQQQYQDYSNVLSDLLFNLTNAETGQRGYLITGDASYLVPYKEAVPAIHADLHALETSPLTVADRSQINEVADISTKKLNELSLTIDAMQTQGQASAFAIVNTNTGSMDMTHLRQTITQITKTQDKDVAARVITTERRTEIMKFFAPIAGILDLGLIITILYLTQRAIRKEQQLEGLKEQFVALASHQLRTPATAVKQYLYLLLAGTYGKLEKRQREVLNIINDSNERGIRITNSLLNVSRASNKEISMPEEPVDLSRLLKEVVDHYSEAIEKGNKQRIVMSMPKKPVLARADPFYVRIIFENLIENAIKYSGTSKKIYVSLKARQNNVTFIVRDEGHGIDKRDIPLIFKKFSRLDQAAKTVDGSGLGLYLVRQAALLHGGDVDIESATGKGSTFKVQLRQGL